MPVIYLNYIVPPDAEPESLLVSQCQLVQLPGSYRVYPAQPPRDTCETIPWVPPDSVYYGSDALFPEHAIRIVGDGVMDGARIVTVEICPMQYRPKTGRLSLVSPIAFSFALSPSTLPNVMPHTRTRYEQAVRDIALANVVENDDEIPRYYQKPAIVDEYQLCSPVPPAKAPGVIIAPEEFHAAFQPYAEWITDQGIATVLVAPEDICSYYGGVDDAERVRNYITDCYQHNGGTYFILGGDDGSVPIRYATPQDKEPGQYMPAEDSIPCDMFFSDLTGDWDYDGDGVWGELTQDQADRFPEVYIGRVPAYNAEEVANWVAKALSYETAPGIAAENLITATWIYNEAIGNGFAAGYMPEYFVHNDCMDQFAYPVAFNELNAGYGMVTVNCHGDIGCFASKWTLPRSYVYNYYEALRYNDTGLNLLNNQNMYSICYSIGCWCGGYDQRARTDPWYPDGSDTCVADGFVDAYANKGSCVYLGNTRNGKYHYADVGPSFVLEHWFYTYLFTQGSGQPIDDNPLSRAGVSEALSKTVPDELWFDPLFDAQYRYVCYSHNLFGSPHTDVWTNIPRELAVIHAGNITAGQLTTFRVRVLDAATSEPIPSAKVCINKPGDLYQLGQTDARGSVTFAVTPRSSGTLRVTVTRVHNLNVSYLQYLPSRTTCEVLGSSEGGPLSGDDQLRPGVLCILALPALTRGNPAIAFGVPSPGEVRLSIYDLTGSLVRIQGWQDLRPGTHADAVDTRGLSSGVYFMRLEQNGTRVSRKVVLVD